MLKRFAGAKPGPVIVSVIVTLGFFGLIVLMYMKPANLDEKSANILNIMFGNLSAAFGAVVNYFLGSSAGSKAKDDILHQIAAGGADKGGA